METENTRVRLHGRARCGTTDIGTWECDVSTERFFIDTITAELFGFDPQEGLRGLPKVTFLAAFHPTDRAKAFELMRRLSREGGSFVFEHRVSPEPNVERWVLARGRYEKNEQGTVARGCGLVIDITAPKTEGYAGGLARSYLSEDTVLVTANTIALSRTTKCYGERTLPLLEMAEHLIAAHRIALDDDDEVTIMMINTALTHVGMRLSKEVASDYYGNA